MRLFTNLLVSIFLFFHIQCEAQDLAYEPLGKETFNGVDIYDVIEDKSNHLWIATSKGLYRYDGYDFVNVSIPEMKSLSVFNLRSDSEGNIYCNNLKNQVFKISNGKLELFYTISEDESHTNTFLEVLPDGRLYLLSKKLIIIDDEDIKKFDLPFSLDRFRVSFYVHPDGKAICVAHEEMAIYDGASISIVPTIELYSEKDFVPTTWVTVGNKIQAIDQLKNRLYTFDFNSKKFQFEKELEGDHLNSALRVYKLRHEIWIAGNQNGIFVYDNSFNLKSFDKKLFEDQFVSDVFVDHEGNVLLSTFKEGVFAIPNTSIYRLNIPNGGRITKMDFINNSKLLFGTMKGNLWLYDISDANYTLLYSSPSKKPIEALHYWKDHGYVAYTTTHGFSVSKLSGNELTSAQSFKGSVKDFSSDKLALYAASNTGAKKIVRSSDGSLAEIELSRERAHAIMSEGKLIYVGTSKGLYRYNLDGTEEFVTLRGQSIFATDLAFVNGNVLVSTRSGVLQYRDGVLYKHLLRKKAIERIVIDNDHAIFQGQEFSETYLANADKFVKIIDDNAALLRKKTLTANANTFYYTQRSSIHFVDSDKLAANNGKIALKIDSVLQDGIRLEQNQFDYSTRKISVHFSAPTIRYRDQLQYRYKLVGYDNGWEYQDYNDHDIDFKGLPAGDYQLDMQTVNGKALGDVVTYRFIVEAPFYKKIWFQLLIVLALLMVVVFIYSRRLKSIQKKNRSTLEKQVMQTNLLEMELKALRSQMNPHFIFNSLNSIQDLVLKEDTDNSYDYLVLFAKLVRNTLNYSNLEYISIKSEKEFLEVYLQLEKLRFKEEFEYEVSYDGSDEIQVPPLIIQPFVENAIVHGLLHKKGMKKLSVKISKNDVLKVIIEDNGIGRKRSAEIQSRMKEHKSFAMNAIKQRLNLINKQLDQDIASFEIIDLYDDDEAAGTRIILHLPIQHAY